MSDEVKEHHSDDHGHDGHMKTYIFVFVALLVLTCVTVLSAKIHFGGYIDIVVALAIAGTKAVLVLSIFMHLNECAKIVKLVAAGTFLWLTILLGYLLIDIESRSWVPVEQGWLDTTTEVVPALDGH